MPDVSVIMPVYNMREYLEACLESVLGQKLNEYTLEVIAVDDGSTDGSGELLDAAAARDPRVKVIHQENSGWPGHPRNRGIEKASGRYLFFCDPDDLMPEESLRRLVTFADTHESDVVIPKIVGGNGRWIRGSLYAQTEIDADLYKAFQTHGPQKLFRRSLVNEHRVRFPEHKMRIEDAMFGFRCYTFARRVSIIADYDYYVLQNRNDGSNISRGGLDPVSYVEDSIQVARIIHQGVPEGELRDRVLAELYRRLCLRRYVGGVFANASPERQNAWISGHRRFIHEFIPPSLDLLLDSVQQQRSSLIRQGRRDDLVTMAASTSEDRLGVEMHGISQSSKGCIIRGHVYMHNQFRTFSWGALELRRRGTGEKICFNVFPDQLTVPADSPPKTMGFQVELDEESLKRYRRGRYDVLFRTSVDGRTADCRMMAPAGQATVHYAVNDFIHFYATKHGNLSCNF